MLEQQKQISTRTATDSGWRQQVTCSSLCRSLVFILSCSTWGKSRCNFFRLTSSMKRSSGISFTCIGSVHTWLTFAMPTCQVRTVVGQKTWWWNWVRCIFSNVMMKQGLVGTVVYYSMKGQYTDLDHGVNFSPSLCVTEWRSYCDRLKIQFGSLNERQKKNFQQPPEMTEMRWQTPAWRRFSLLTNQPQSRRCSVRLSMTVKTEQRKESISKERTEIVLL